VVDEPIDGIADERRGAGRMKETEWEVRWVTVPWMNWRRGNSSSSSSEEKDEADEVGDRGGVGSLDVDAVDSTGTSAGSSIFVYGIKAFGA